MPKILNPADIKNPIGALVLEERKPGDWERDLGAVREVLCPDRSWVKFVTEFELQHNSNFDAYDCVTQATWNKIQCLAKRLGDTLNKSKRWTAIRSGTKAGSGNSVTAVVECVRKMGGVPEEVCPSMSPTMTQDEFYAPIPSDVDSKEDFLKNYDYTHEWLPSPDISGTLDKIIDQGLLYSPVMVSIEGVYNFDAEGRLQWGNGGYAHEILIVESHPDYFLVVDSENPSGLMKVRRDYLFLSPKIGTLTSKKKTNNMLVKFGLKPAVYLQIPSGELFGISDSLDITGGDLLRLFSGSYGNAGIQHLEESEFDPSKVVGKVSAERN